MDKFENCKNCSKNKKCYKCISVKTQNVKNLNVKNSFNVDTINSKNSISEVSNTSALFINNRLFPTSVIPVVINDTITITNGTGLYAMGKSFTGNITLINCQSLSLNLVNQILTGTIEIINCNQIVVFDGSVNNPIGTSIDIKNSTDIVFNNLNISDTLRGITCLEVEDISIVGVYIENIYDYAIRLEKTNDIIFFNITIRNIESYTNKSIIDIVNCQGMFFNKIFFNDINYHNLIYDHKNIISISDNSYDMKFSEISILRVKFFSNIDIQVNHIHIENSGSIIVRDLIIDGNYLYTTGPIKSSHTCIKVKNSNNFFGEKCLLTDNGIISDQNAIELKMHTVAVSNVVNMSLKDFAINSTFISGGINCIIKDVRGFYGESGGNWVFADLLLNSQYFSDGINGTCYGLEINNVYLSITIAHCISNNNGYYDETYTIYPDQCGGFLAKGISDSNITFLNCTSNSNTGGTSTISYNSSYDNTEFMNCSSNGNYSSIENGKIVSFYIPGNSDIQKDVLINNCISNNYPDGNLNSYGVYSGEISLVKNLRVQHSGFMNNYYGIYLYNTTDSCILKCTVNYNNDGINIDSSSNILIQDNISQQNSTGYLDNTPNTYINNKSIGDIIESYDLTGFAISLFKLNKLDGKYINISGETIFGSYSNIEVD